MKRNRLPFILSSIVALTAGTQEASANPLADAWGEFTCSVQGVCSAAGDLIETAWDAGTEAAEEAWVNASDAIKDGAQKAARAIQGAYETVEDGIVDFFLDAKKLAQEGWQKMGQYYVKFSDGVHIAVITTTCKFKYSIEATRNMFQAIGNIPSQKILEFHKCMEKQNWWAKMVSPHGHVIGQNIPCLALLGSPNAPRVIEAVINAHNARLTAYKNQCGNFGGMTYAKTNTTSTQKTPTPQPKPVQATPQLIVNGVNCTGEGIAWGFGKNGVCSATTCMDGYERTHVGNEIYTCKKKAAPVFVKSKPGDPCITKNARVAKINSEGNCAAMECVDGYELARYDNGNSKGFCIKSTPKVEPVVREPVHIEPLETQVALLKVEPIGAPDITLKMPEPALAVATPESNQVADTAPAPAPTPAPAPASALDKKLAKLDAQKQALIEKDQAKQLLAQQKAQEEELKRQQKELADLQKQQDAIAKAEAKQAAALAKADEREANKAARQEAREERQEERALAQAERQAAREERQEERALAQAAKDAERDAEQQERQSLGLTQVEYNNYKKNQEKIEQMKINLEQQRQQLNMT